MFKFRNVIVAIFSISAVFLGAPKVSAQEHQDRMIRLSFSDGRADVSGLEAVNAHLLKVGVRVFDVPIPDEARPITSISQTRALNEAEQKKLLSIFSLDRQNLLEVAKAAGRAPAVKGGGALSISEANVPPYPKVYDLKALDEKTLAFLKKKFGKLHVNSADSGEGIDEVMTIVSGGPFTWFFVLEDGAVAKVRFSPVGKDNPAWRISYPGLVPHGAYLDAADGLVMAHAYGPKTFVMRYEDRSVQNAARLNDNPWIEFSANPPKLLERPRNIGTARQTSSQIVPVGEGHPGDSAVDSHRVLADRRQTLAWNLPQLICPQF